jgi:phage gpG-like protein
MQLTDLLRRLESLSLSAAEADGLEHAGENMIAAVKDELSFAAGEDATWPALRSGELRNSVSYYVDDHELVVGSSSIVAVYQEYGTSMDSPRPFLAPAAMSVGSECAQDIAATIRATLSEVLR